MKLLITLEKGEDGYIIAECPAIPGCVILNFIPHCKKYLTFARVKFYTKYYLKEIHRGGLFWKNWNN